MVYIHTPTYIFKDCPFSEPCQTFMLPSHTSQLYKINNSPPSPSVQLKQSITYPFISCHAHFTNSIAPIVAVLSYIYLSSLLPFSITYFRCHVLYILYSTAIQPLDRSSSSLFSPTSSVSKNRLTQLVVCRSQLHDLAVRDEASSIITSNSPFFTRCFFF